MANIPKNYTFKFVKSPDFKTIKIDGLFGGATVKGEINANFYVDTIDLPRSQLFAVDSKGKITNEIIVPNKAESIRELVVAINMDVITAKNVILWLNEKVSQIEKLTVDTNK
jgi:hypothetical protein